MGLYDDDLEPARASAEYHATGRLAEGLKPAPAVTELAVAVEALEALAAGFPVLADSDDGFKAWLALAVQAGRAVRAAGATGWASIAEAHPAFVHRMDMRDGMKRFETSGRLGYQLWHPAAWRTRVSDNEERFVASPDAGFSDGFLVLMEALPFQATLEGFAAGVIDRLRRELPGCSLGDRRFRRLDRADALEIDYTGTRDGGPLRCRDLLAIYGNTALTLSHKAAPERFAEQEPVVREIVESFRLKG